MFFRNLTLYRFADGAVTRDAAELEAALQKLPLKKISAVESVKRGFVSPWGRHDERMLMSDADAHLFVLGGYDKVMPAAAVAEAVQKRCDEMEARTGEPPTFADKRQLGDEVRARMLAQAFLKPVRIRAYIDVERGWLVVNTSSRSQAEALVMHLRSALGSFQCTPVVASESPRRLMTAWLMSGSVPMEGRTPDQILPKGLTFGEDCDLRDPADKSRKWSGRRVDVDVDVTEHLHAGLQVERLAFNWQPFGADRQHLSFVLDENVLVRALHFTDAALGQVSEEDRQEATDKGAAGAVDFCLMNREIRILLDMLELVFKIERSPPLKLEDQPAPQAMRDAAADEKYAENTSNSNDDVLLAKAVELTKESGKVSVAFVQRSFKIGYNRAARLVEAMEILGVVSAPNANGFRTVIETSTAADRGGSDL